MSKRSAREEPDQQLKRPGVVAMGMYWAKTKIYGEKKSLRKPSMKSRSIAPSVIDKYEREEMDMGRTPEEMMEDERFFDEYVPTSHLAKSSKFPGDKPKQKPSAQRPATTGEHQLEKQKSSVGRISRKVAPANQSMAGGGKGKKKESGFVVKRKKRRPDGSIPEEDEEDDDDVDDDEYTQFLGTSFKNANRKYFGFGLMSKVFGGKPSGKQLDLRKKNRPFFTWWVTIVQILVYIVSVAIYGIAPIGIGMKEITDEVLMTSLAIEQVSVFKETNLWIGPSQESLIHLGARYSPCMRIDANIQDVLAIDDSVINETACCIRNDGAGCVQTLEADCNPALNTWYKYTASNLGYQDRLSGSVCGQDPEYCTDPASTGAFIWEDDITKWPVCKTAANVSKSATTKHMTCEVNGRPCCLGIQGECVIATREYCEFREGYFHQDAALCSQVDCMGEVCGMIPFLVEGEPDQFYRLFTTLFLHAGVLQLLISVLFQLIFMRDLEKMTGTWRMVLIYMGSGVAGALASAIFLPYMVESGPSGAMFGVIACMFVEILRWNKDDNVGMTFLKLGIVLLVLFVFGLLPMIDNWAHLFGFAFGLMLSIAFRPYTSLCKTEIGKGGRIGCTLVFLALAVVIFAIVVVLFYLYPVYECSACMYFNCVPFTETFCEGASVTISRNTTTTSI